MKKRSLFLFVSLFFFLEIDVKAEYRAYLLEIYDVIDKVNWEVNTGIPPDVYIQTHGGASRLRAIMKATWMCYGETSQYQYVCEMPTPRFPKFDVGDRVKVTLEKHLTKDWQGVIEVALWREDLKSNIYGVRFKETGNLLFSRYFEFNLEKLPEPDTEDNKESGTSRTL